MCEDLFRKFMKCVEVYVLSDKFSLRQYRQYVTFKSNNHKKQTLKDMVTLFHK